MIVHNDLTLLVSQLYDVDPTNLAKMELFVQTAPDQSYAYATNASLGDSVQVRAYHHTQDVITEQFSGQFSCR